MKEELENINEEQDLGEKWSERPEAEATHTNESESPVEIRNGSFKLVFNSRLRAVEARIHERAKPVPKGAGRRKPHAGAHRALLAWF